MYLIKGTLQTFTAHVLIFLQGLVIIPLITKTSGIEVYGYYNILISLLGLIYGISSFGYGYNAMRYLPSSDTKKKRSELFFTQFYFQILSVIFLSLILVIIIFFSNENGFFPIGDLSIIFIPMYLIAQVLYGQSTIYLRFTNKIGLMNIATASRPYLFILFTLLIYNFFNELKINWIFSSNIFSLIIMTIFIFNVIKKEINFKVSVPTFKSFKQDIILGLPLAISFLVETMIIVGDRYIIALFMTIKDVGSYASAYTIGGISIVFAKVFNVILPPFISRKLDKDEKQTCIEVIGIALRVYLVLTIPFAFGSIVFAREIMELFTNLEATNIASNVIPIISFATIFFGITLILNTILFVEKKTKVILKINIFVAIINLLLNFILISIFRSVEIAAATTLISYLIGLILLKRHLDEKWINGINTKLVLHIVVFSIIILFTLIYTKSLIKFENIIINILFGICVGFVQYLFLIILHNKLFDVELNLIKKYIFKKKYYKL